MTDQLVTDQPAARPSALAPPPAPRSIFVADRPCADCADPLAALFADLAAHACAETPLALAVVGPAGSGKSSFLHTTLARIEAIAAAPATAGSPFAANLLAARVDLAHLPETAGAGEVAAALSAALRRALARAGGDWAKAADEADAAGADPRTNARAAADAYDEARKRADAETGDLEALRARRARLPEALLYETPGSRVDAYARAGRARIDANLRRFGYVEADSTLAYKTLVSEVAEQGGGARAALLLRAVWGFASQRRLLIWAAVLVALSALFGATWDGQTVWGPQLRAQGQAGDATATFLLTKGWLATFRDAAFWIAILCVALNLWRAWRFAAPLQRGAHLLRQEVAERAQTLDGQIAAQARRADALRQDAETARKAAEEAGARLARPDAERAARDDFASADPDERFLEALPRALAARGEGRRLVVGLDGLDGLAPATAARALVLARRWLDAPGLALIAAFDGARLAPGLEAEPARRRDAFERLFQAGWRLEPDAGAPAPDAARASLDEPFAPIEQETLARVAPLAGGLPRRTKRLANLYRLARRTTPDRAALALMLAAELGRIEGDPLAANAALAEGREESPYDPRLISALRAARAASPNGTLSAGALTSARRLARRFVVLEADV